MLLLLAPMPVVLSEDKGLAEGLVPLPELRLLVGVAANPASDDWAACLASAAPDWEVLASWSACWLLLGWTKADAMGRGTALTRSAFFLNAAAEFG